jgi:TolB-like protein/Tfp pilus assembly protein PilF
MSGFVSELRRRNVLRVAAAYALVAWIIIEAGSVLLPTFGANENVFQVYVIVVLVGFVIALICAWVFEITPDGVKLDKDVDRSLPASAAGNRRMNYAIIGLLVVALMVSVTFNVAEIPLQQEDDDASKMSMRRSIAVLPFASRSNDPENQFFADGIHDDLLTKLARFGSLRVISRTSVLEYRDTAKNLRQIGEELGVDTILEGAVQRSGNEARINVQLIDAATDEHLWAQTYDRDLGSSSVFELQSQIATEISGALQSRLLPGGNELEPTVDIATRDLRAYSLYVSGRDNLYKRRLETTEEARQQFEQAIALDPEYAEAHVGLAESLVLLAINHASMPLAEAAEEAEQLLNKALEIDPNLSDAYATLGLLKSSKWLQTRIGAGNAEAEAAFEQAIGLNPNNAQAYMWFAALRTSEQRFEDAIAFYHRSMQLDPLGRVPYSNLPVLYAQLGQNDIALKLLLEAIAIHPEWPTPYQIIAAQLAALGRLDEALAWNRKAVALSNDPAISSNIAAGIWFQFGDLQRAKDEFEALPAGNPFQALTPAVLAVLDYRLDDGLQVYREALADNPQLPAFVLDIASDLALMTGDLELAEQYILRREPRLKSDAGEQVDRLNVRNVVKLAYIRQREGDAAAAQRLLEAALAVVQSMPRLGLSGYGVRDAQIYALLNRPDDAIAALHEAVAEGFRSSLIYDNWVLDLDPLLGSLRSDERFVAIVAELETLLAPMYQAALAADEQDAWEALRARAAAK